MVDREKIKNLPTTPGVYIMRDKSGTVIYVGKAIVLKNRVSQYFNNSPKPRKVEAMVSNIADFEYIITLTESDALALESNLIKKYKPYYNILLKDDKADPYIKIDLKEDYPTIEVTRKVKKDGSKYFGPYFNGVRVGEIVDVIRSVYGMRTCPKKLKKNKRPCLNYDIGLCKGCCVGYISKEDYALVVEQVMRFLSGYEEGAQKVIEEKMMKSAQNEDFESAIRYREQLEMLKRLRSRTIANMNAVNDIDCFSYATDGTYSVMSVAIVRANKMLGVKNYSLTDASLELEDAYTDFVMQYYQSGAAMPKEIGFCEKFNSSALEEYIAKVNEHTSVVFPKIAIKHRICEMARRNSADYLAKSIEKNKKEEAMTTIAVKRLEELLSIASARRIECFDISNISGTDKVASNVVFIDGKAEKSEYRRYKIKTVEGADDFASMKEVITRRLRKISEGAPRPDLIVIDGGKGQLSSAIEASIEVGERVDMIALAKKREEIFVPSLSDPIVLKREDNIVKLLQRVRDEAHRFAVLYHRNVRAKSFSSSLLQINGVGEKTAKILLSAFTSMQQIKDASLDTLRAIDGISERVAISIWEHYHNDKQ